MLNLEKYDSQQYRKYTLRLEIDKALHTLEGILIGITIDNILNEYELKELSAWCELYSNYINRQPLGDILNTIKKSIEDGIIDENEREDILWLCNNYKIGNMYFDIITSDVQRLHGILHGILADGVITDSEIKALKNWLEDNEHLIGTYPYDEIYSLLISILSDGFIDDYERKILKLFLSDFVDTKCSSNLNRNEIEELREKINISGICSICPEIIINNKLFCFTGTSSKTTRKQISEVIISFGGRYHDKVTKETDYLVIGNNGNPCWAFSCYGRKVEQAVNLRKKGHKILIVHENDFWDALESLK
ncbi:BRCA1 C Terminus (BRCT) domain-containing protein [Caloramator quimbayensis]|uniref:BRCA1 C Terminus (BRCT) domain-containing protein n=1 Tax=Caloramator quimbayensis TaxID=1147123 RepID=A0A1T4WYD7_9CLOT|nr:BRCT domain-containing protein [Caloramator quimbayensis]SKA82324.1 BRCA1 C Terminus (BRCT) domain-containing protein [Caloramator quimbayensis]